MGMTECYQSYRSTFIATVARSERLLSATSATAPFRVVALVAVAFQMFVFSFRACD
jgi:hypothetical protein